MAKSKPPSPPAAAGTGSHAERCAFCGRREIEAGRLISGAKAAICADCVRKLGQGLKSAKAPPRR
jgi:hypothetical protein